jgi:hypothetical protein
MVAVLLACHGVVSVTARPDAHQPPNPANPFRGPESVPLTMPPRLPERADDIASYDISVKLDAEKKQLSGKQRLTWRNSSPDTIGDLWFHLYLNAFRNSNSTFFRESSGQLRDDAMPEDGWGWIEVDSMTLVDAAGANAGAGVDLKPSMRFEAPDDGNKDDRTVARVMLPRPLNPGETITLDIAFTAQLPKVFARTGYVRDYFLVGQWFPKIAVYEPAGMRGRTAGGWNCRQFHGHSEFYADFGKYRVDITLPSHFVVGATGVRAEKRDNGNGTSTHIYEQENVHDFAWTASPHFVEQRRNFVASREVTAKEYADTGRLLDRESEEMRLQDVEVILLMQPEHMPQVERHFAAAMLSIKWFGLMYGRYPHRTLTIVDPAAGADGSGGMEYPTFITAGTSPRLNGWPFDGVRLAEEVIVHEFGHQYFQGMIANNEFEEAWLDEGMNSYATGRIMERGFGRDATMVSLFGWQVGQRDYLRTAIEPDIKFTAINQPSWTYPDDWSYSINSYVRPELTLRTIEHLAGAQTMARVMRTYAERWRFKHPSTQDFYAVANEVSGRDLRAMMTQIIDRGELVDYEIGKVTSQLAEPPTGFVDGAKGREFVSQADADEALDEQEHPSYDTRVVVRRRGEAILPVVVAFKFEGKDVERQTWDGVSRWRAFTFRRPERLEWVDVDPDRHIELDADWLNNSRRLEPDQRAAVRLTSRWTFLLQQALASLGM